ncbi:MAG TPA: glycosyltransferase family 39 protein [Vicinamibacterales bacterium]|nr:glycosyltransferase family 39 protein [Vicinamibacterales bacterium]
MPSLLQLAALLVVAWLPGAVLFRAPVFERRKREALSAEERVFWCVVVSIAISLAVVLALAWVNRYTFPRLLGANVVAAGAALLFWRGRLRMPQARRAGLTALIPLALVILCMARFFPPSEYVIGGKDPGTYMNEGIQIGQRGSLVIRDPVVAAVPPFARDLFYPQHVEPDGSPRAGYYGIRFMGFYITDPDAGAVIGQFPHLFPASIAVGYGLDGLTGARRTAGFWALLGVLAVYFAGARLFGRPAAAMAAALLALHVIQVWFARYPNAEVVMQALTFAALLANARAHIDDDPFFAPIAGALLGLLLFLRFDSALAIGAVGAGLLLALFTGRRVRASFLLAFGIPAVLAVPYLLGPMRAYAELPIQFFGRVYWVWPGWQLTLAAALVVAAVAGAVFALRRGYFRRPIEGLAPGVIAVVVVVAALYALWLRQPGGKLTDYDAHALRMYAHVYVTLPGVFAALLGYWLLARDRFWRDPALFLIAAVFSLTLFYKLRIVPEHFWLARRFVPVILPGTLLFATGAAFATAGSGWIARAVRWTIGSVFVVLLAGAYVRAAAPVVSHVEYEGLIPRLETLAARLAPEDLVIVEARDAQSDVHVLGLPLAYIYARNVLVLSSARPDKGTFAAFLEWARTRYGRVYFLGGGGTDLLSHSYGVRAVASERFQVPEFETTREGLPRRAARKEFEFGLYEFVAPQRYPGGWFDLDVGTNDDLHVLRFYAKEVSDDVTFRWTRSRSFVSVTTITATARELTLVMADGGRPAAAPDAVVEVYLHNQRLGTVQVKGPWRPYSLEVPRDIAARAAGATDPVELRLVTSTWNPADVLGVADSRDLGVMLDRVTIR